MTFHKTSNQPKKRKISIMVKWKRASYCSWAKCEQLLDKLEDQSDDLDKQIFEVKTKGHAVAL